MYKVLQHCKLDTLTTLVLNLNHGTSVGAGSPKAYGPPALVMPSSEILP
jgi:hypothetical protein